MFCRVLAWDTQLQLRRKGQHASKDECVDAVFAMHRSQANCLAVDIAPNGWIASGAADGSISVRF